MIWQPSHRFDRSIRDLADRHYNRQKIGSPQFVPPGRCIVLKAETETGRAFWVTSWPFQEFTKHAWAGAWICSAFRNEGAGRASDLIRDAIAATLAAWPAPPALGMVTFLNRSMVRPTMRRGQETWGRTFELVGFRYAGETGSGLMALQLLPEHMPAAALPLGSLPFDLAHGG